MLFTILYGMILRNIRVIPSTCNSGLGFCAKTILRIGVVFLGFRLSIPEVLKLGFGPLLTILLTVVVVFAATLAIGTKLKGGHAFRILTASGTAICGAAAIAGITCVLKPHKNKQVQTEKIGVASATAVATITIFGTLAMMLTPILASRFGLSETQTGVWIGASIHEVGQVIAAAGFTGSDRVIDVATVTKLGRVVLLAGVVAIVGYLENKTASSADSQSSTKKVTLVPLFVLGFLATMCLRSAAGWLGIEDSLTGVFEVLNQLSTWLLVIAMGAMGTNVDIASLVKSGKQSMLLGFIAALIASAVSLALTLIFVN